MRSPKDPKLTKPLKLPRPNNRIKRSKVRRNQTKTQRIENPPRRNPKKELKRRFLTLNNRLNLNKRQGALEGQKRAWRKQDQEDQKRANLQLE